MVIPIGQFWASLCWQLVCSEWCSGCHGAQAGSRGCKGMYVCLCWHASHLVQLKLLRDYDNSVGVKHSKTWLFSAPIFYLYICRIYIYIYGGKMAHWYAPFLCAEGLELATTSRASAVRMDCQCLKTCMACLSASAHIQPYFLRIPLRYDVLVSCPPTASAMPIFLKDFSLYEGTLST